MMHAAAKVDVPPFPHHYTAARSGSSRRAICASVTNVARCSRRRTALPRWKADAHGRDVTFQVTTIAWDGKDFKVRLDHRTAKGRGPQSADLSV
jgi:hypothetical protein